MKKNSKPNVRTFYCPTVPDQWCPFWEINLDTGVAGWYKPDGTLGYPSDLDVSDMGSDDIELNPGSRDPKDILGSTKKPSATPTTKKRKGFKKDRRRVQYGLLQGTLYRLDWKNNAVDWMDKDGWNPSYADPTEHLSSDNIKPITKAEAERFVGRKVIAGEAL